MPVNLHPFLRCRLEGGAGSETGRPPTPYSRSHLESPVPSFTARYHRSSADEDGPSASSLLSGVNRTESANKRFSALECLLLGVKRKSISGDPMSAYSHKQTSGWSAATIDFRPHRRYYRAGRRMLWNAASPPYWPPMWLAIGGVNLWRGWLVWRCGGRV